jgi:hypothetical protein
MNKTSTQQFGSIRVFSAIRKFSIEHVLQLHAERLRDKNWENVQHSPLIKRAQKALQSIQIKDNVQNPLEFLDIFQLFDSA